MCPACVGFISIGLRLQNSLTRIRFHKYSTKLVTQSSTSLTTKRLFGLTSKTSAIQLSLENAVIQKFVRDTVEEYRSILHRVNTDTDDSAELKAKKQRLVTLQPVAECIQLIESKKSEIHELEKFIKDGLTKDREMLQMANGDKIVCEEALEELEKQLFNLILPVPNSDFNELTMEVTAGVGGLEAMLFTKELFNMYVNYAAWKGWKYEIVDYQTSELDGLRHASLFVNGAGAYSLMKFESGVHRVQRIPKTEKSGRVHTSTAAVAVLPHPSDIEININPSDLQIETKRSSGAGGQHVNKTESAVRITHAPTGITVDCQVSRSQITNRSLAMQKLRAKMYQQKYEQQLNMQQSSRKIQIGTSGRSEKIRTYNYSQDRISDHRLEHNFHDMTEFLKGGNGLDTMLGELAAELQKEILLETITQSQIIKKH